MDTKSRLTPNIDWLKQNAKIIHYFGLGFIQIKINEAVRFHVYHPQYMSIMPPEEVHNHRYYFRSIVVKGTLLQHIYKVSWLGTTHEMWRESCEPGVPPEFGGMVTCDQVMTLLMTQGSQYAINHDVYHRIEAHDKTMTRIERGAKIKDRASVIRERGVEKVCPFSKQVPEKELWECVEDVLDS